MKNNPNSDAQNPQLEHIPVLLKEAVDLLLPKVGGVFVDGTLGGGGHAAEILERSAPDGVLIGMDRDVEAVERCKEHLAAYAHRTFIRQANFSDISRILQEADYQAVDGILLDLGISWFHLKTPERGFSFMLDGPLDMRMDRNDARQTAADLVNTLSGRELAKILSEYGEEHRAGAIARAIEKARTRGPITNTIQLAEIVSSVFPPHPPRRIHPATLTFQALRIAVNDELGVLQDGLKQCIARLKSGGRIVVITFHSLEDRIVKQTFAAGARDCVCPPRMPICTCGKRPELKVLTRRPMKAGPEEVARNPAARSAKLRAAEKV
jgi:16S rRNA (cytosine1402-N4)-methyltransferase